VQKESQLIGELNNVWAFLKYGLENYPALFAFIVIVFLLVVVPLIIIAVRQPEALKYILPWRSSDTNAIKDGSGSVDAKKMEKVKEEVDESLSILKGLMEKVDLLKREVSNLSKVMAVLQEMVDEGCKHLGQDCIQAVKALKGDIEEVKKELERREKSYIEWQKLEEERRKLKEERESLKHEDIKNTLTDIAKKISELESLLKDIEKTVKSFIGESKGRFH